MRWSMEWTEWKIEYDYQVYTNNYNEHVAVMEVNVKWYGERKENKKNPVLSWHLYTLPQKR